MRISLIKLARLFTYNAIVDEHAVMHDRRPETSRCRGHVIISHISK